MTGQQHNPQTVPIKQIQLCLILLAAAAPFSFSIWMALLNNFTVEVANFTGTEIGLLQSIREVPGFLAFTAIFLLLFIREQLFAFLALIALGMGVALTGFFPNEIGLYLTTVIMSVGFHYFETIQMSLSLQWLPKDIAPKSLGQQFAAKSVGALIAYLIVFIMLQTLGIDYKWLYLIGGAGTMTLALYIWMTFPRIEGHTPQNKTMVLRKRYWLFYALTFMGGARRQIFVVFAGFLMVTKFDFSAAEVTALYLANHIINTWFAPKVGKAIGSIGERKVLIFEYIGLIFVFGAYAVVNDPIIAGVLYVVDHLFFAFAIAHKSYLQKIADPADIAATSSVSFSINHIAAVFIPALFGAFLWSQSPSYVFIAGALMAGVSLILSLNVPRNPRAGNEVIYGRTQMHRAGQPAE